MAAAETSRRENLPGNLPVKQSQWGEIQSNAIAAQFIIHMTAPVTYRITGMKYRLDIALQLQRAASLTKVPRRISWTLHVRFVPPSVNHHEDYQSSGVYSDWGLETVILCALGAPDVDSRRTSTHDLIWVYQRPHTMTKNEKGANCKTHMISHCLRKFSLAITIK